MRLVLGLGNPGAEYVGTRHNVGYAVVEELARRYGIELDRARHRAKFGKGRMGDAVVLLAEPLTYMNLSGEAAKPLLSYHGMDADELIVVHDEADLEPGTVRVKQGGGLAGHNGLKSIAAHLGTREFPRVRVGIGRPEGGGGHMSRHVLSKPSPDVAAALADGVDRAADAVEVLIREGAEAAMRRFNVREGAS